MRSRVAGVFPLKVQPATWVAAIAVAAFWVAASLYVADHIVASNAPSVQPRATIATEPTQIPNRAAKAAREAFKKEARLDEDVAGPNPEIVTPLPEDDGDDEGQTETGRASWYQLDSKTASGEPMDATALTAAHPTLPLGTQVRVVNLDNDRAVVVRINDRGPFAKGRVIDLSRAAAVALDMIEAGVAEVRVTPIAGVIASN
jgi:rare lipoprotein A (peptidoglycan hydrolase)